MVSLALYLTLRDNRMARQISTRNSKTPIPVIIGAGITEQWYFTHLRDVLNLRVKIRPRYFGTEDIKQLDKKISQIVNEGSIAICVFDADTSEFDDTEKAKVAALKKKYDGKKNVILCDSLPSIEYWFLLHFEDTNKHFANSRAAEKELQTFIPQYEKKESFLQNQKWVEDMITNGGLDAAVSRSRRYDTGQGSYTNVYRAIERLSDKK